MKRRHFTQVLVVLVACIMPRVALGTEDGKTQGTLVAFIVRHAEKQDSGADPELSDKGKERAAKLARMLVDAGIEGVYSTDYKRTKSTARPLAEAKQVDVQVYDPRKLADFAQVLKEQGGRQLVVGHSNTTPALVKLLGGEPGAPIDDAREFDRLYVVTVASDGIVTTVLMRY